MLIAWLIFFCSNKVIALKKMIGRMVQKHNPNDGDKHITEFKKRKSAQNHASQSVKPMIHFEKIGSL
jgi:hypothetical protein